LHRRHGRLHGRDGRLLAQFDRTRRLRANHGYQEGGRPAAKANSNGFPGELGHVTRLEVDLPAAAIFQGNATTADIEERGTGDAGQVALFTARQDVTQQDDVVRRRARRRERGTDEVPGRRLRGRYNGNIQVLALLPFQAHHSLWRSRRHPFSLAGGHPREHPAISGSNCHHAGHASNEGWWTRLRHSPVRERRTVQAQPPDQVASRQWGYPVRNYLRVAERW
jgi:hypothetical protein